MAGTTLAIQGPPGTGKTYVSALSVVNLVRVGKRIAVSSNSHKAIGNLLEAVADRARQEGVVCRVVQKSSDDGDDEVHPGITFVSDNDAPEIAAAHVVGATAWHFARYAEAAYDYLIVDEAGQVSIANILAMARCARNIVLVGDPMQLPQPLQGSHPGDSGRSCLEYLIDGHRVVPSERGVFMPISRRMHPRVCGLGAIYRDRDGRERVVGHSDILVVAPYNAQVNALRVRLPNAVRVGTVDRFQGQEAPICLVSMTTSSGEELPRDIAFLFSLNRINVAVSRAQVAAMVFASPLLLETPCRSIEEMALVNALCLLHEYGGDSF